MPSNVNEEQAVEITSFHVALFKKYLKALDLIVDCPIEHGDAKIEQEEHILFTQPGKCYCQAQALVYSLMKDKMFKLLAITEKNYVTGWILEEVGGRMLEEIILLETVKVLGKNYNVFKLQFESGEYDMVIYDKKNDCCAAYEIKHSDKCVREQARHLLIQEKLDLFSPRFGRLKGRYTIFGKNLDGEEGIAYCNAQSQYKKPIAIFQRQ